jgi:hypothetical protein
MLGRRACRLFVLLAEFDVGIEPRIVERDGGLRRDADGEPLERDLTGTAR